MTLFLTVTVLAFVFFVTGKVWTALGEREAA